MIATMARKAGDRLLALVLPRLDEPARAVDCQTEQRCFGNNLRRRTCCLHSNGSVTCTPWGGGCNDCCD